MDRNELILRCRQGDLPRVKYLVENKEVEINIRDKWDSTPLYYACLCGHYDVVKYLLENGARCEANTFDGERCLYASLTTRIRNLLRNFKVVTSKTLRRDKYAEFLRRCFETKVYHDVAFVVKGENIPAHRCILLARCEYFKEMLCGRWRGRNVIHVSFVKPAAFKAVLQHLYTGRLDVHLDDVDDCLMLAGKCGLVNLIGEIRNTMRKIKISESAQPGTRITTLSVEPRSFETELQQDFGILAKSSLPRELNNWVDGNELSFLSTSLQPLFADVSIHVQGHNFLCHKVFICGRSDYFKALLTDHFSEITEELIDETNIKQITLPDITLDIFLQILYYIYQNTADLDSSVVLDVLCAADMYLLPGLKRQCAVVIEQNLDVTNVTSILKYARMYNLPRLEDSCAHFIANHFEQVAESEEFHEFVISDAKNVKHRQETDSISVIDDIRYYMTCNVQTFSAAEDAAGKLKAVNELLEKLELGA